jgi:two-component system phosphate regulon sensor histidine kinase PhoR
VDSSPRKSYEGTGSGLSIVREILSMHGCAIRVESKVGVGTTFTIELPIYQGKEQTDEHHA